MGSPALLAENFYNPVLFGGHTISANEEAPGHEAFYVADGRRSTFDYWTAITANQDAWIKAACDQPRIATMLALDRGHNLAGRAIKLQQSTDNFAANTVDVFSATVPSIATPGSGLDLGKNSVLQSENFENASWTKTRSSITANAAPALNGRDVLADKLIEDASVTTTHTITQAVTITSAENVAVSVYLKPGERSRCRLQFGDSTTTNGFRIDVDLIAVTTANAGNYGAGVLSGSSIEAVANGWYRVKAWGTVNGGVTAGQLFLLLEDNTGNPTYTGDGSSGLYLFGAQVERNGATVAAPTSYVHTTSVIASRTLTEEGAWIARFPAVTSQYFRLFIPAVSAFVPKIVGLWLGSAYVPPASVFFLPWDEDQNDLLTDEIQTPFGWVGTGTVIKRRSGTINLRMGSIADYDNTSRYHLQQIFGARRPTWICYDDAFAERSFLAVRPGGNHLSIGYSQRFPRDGQLQYTELEPLLP